MSRLGHLLAALAAGVASVALIVIGALRDDSTLVLVAGLGVLIAGCLGLVAEAQWRTADDHAGDLAALRSDMDRAISSQDVTLDGLSKAAAEIGAGVSELRHEMAAEALGCTVITRERFYREATALAKKPPAAGAVVRVGNMYGAKPSPTLSDGQQLWYHLLGSDDFKEAKAPTIRRIKLVGDEESFLWTLRDLHSHLGDHKINVALHADLILGDTDPLVYPLNAHCYYDKVAYVLLPGFSSQSAGPDAPVLKVSTREAVKVLSSYHDTLFATCLSVMERGQVRLKNLEKLADKWVFDSQQTRDALVALQ